MPHSGIPRLLVALEDVLLALTARTADVWDVQSVPGLRAPQCLAADPGNAARVYCGTAADGVWRSLDAGASWQRTAALRLSDVTALAVSHDRATAESTLYAGTEPSEIFRSVDEGETWDECQGLDRLPSATTWSFPPRPQTHHVRWIWPDPAVSGRVFVAIEAGALIRSLDGGQTWRDRVAGGPYDTHTLVSRANDPDHLYVAAGDGYYESRDGGESWSQPTEGLAHRYLFGVAVDGSGAPVTLVSAAHGPFSAYDAREAETYLYRRVAEDRWAPVHDGLPPATGTTISSIVAAPQQGAFYLANNRGVFVSHGGKRWEAIPVAWPERFLHQSVRALLYAS